MNWSNLAPANLDIPSSLHEESKPRWHGPPIHQCASNNRVTGNCCNIERLPAADEARIDQVLSPSSTAYLCIERTNEGMLVLAFLW